ncbi:MAG: hypothetical protein ACE5D7_10150 [Fidelibacterota bacterium]
MKAEKSIRAKYRALQPMLNERSKRLWAGTEAKAIGRGGIAIVVRATGLARKTITRGIRELKNKQIVSEERVRCRGAGRKRKVEIVPGLAKALEKLIEPVTRGDPESPLRWTSKSTRHLAAELNKQGYTISHSLVGTLLHELGYSLQSNRKTLEGSSHPDRNQQFEHINKTVKNRLSGVSPFFWGLPMAHSFAA